MHAISFGDPLNLREAFHQGCQKIQKDRLVVDDKTMHLFMILFLWS
ncbi:hypothetical protein SynNOUM97013_00592 [Synechococcus sp. NOUM97013]|nr:hypothetical protein SynNOUM97013_00592 [Synechococcus sp. NOUM97013]